jgi:cytochrome d ubiquinol oxidase subunit II
MSGAVAVVLFFGVTAYALFGGADFGSGFWDLTAGGAERGKRPRAVVSHSIGPVWEANHVWLVFILVVMWTAFSEAFASIMLTLFVPLSVAALGIVMRGSSFAPARRSRARRNATSVPFATSSVLVPFFSVRWPAPLHRHAPAGGVRRTWSSWLNPTSILGAARGGRGALSQARCTVRRGPLQRSGHGEYFRRRGDHRGGCRSCRTGGDLCAA